MNGVVAPHSTVMNGAMAPRPTDSEWATVWRLGKEMGSLGRLALGLTARVLLCVPLGAMDCGTDDLVMGCLAFHYGRCDRRHRAAYHRAVCRTKEQQAAHRTAVRCTVRHPSTRCNKEQSTAETSTALFVAHQRWIHQRVIYYPSHFEINHRPQRVSNRLELLRGKYLIVVALHFEIKHRPQRSLTD